MSKIAAIIVTYNRKDKLRRCLEAVFAQTTETKPDIIIVDNGSSDGTEDMIREMIEYASEDIKNKIIYRNLRYNSGGAGGFCYGVRKAVEGGYDYLWLMDDDSIADERALEELLNYNEKHKDEYGFLASKVLWTDGSLCRMNIQRETFAKNVRNWDREIISIAMSSFVSCFLPREVVLKVGLPIKEFFVWSDDWEYTRRISREYPCYLITPSTVIHDIDINSGADISSAKTDMLDRYKKLYRNDVYIYRREGKKGIAYEVARIIIHVARIIRSSQITREKMRRIGIVLKGTVDGLSFHPIPEKVEE